MNSDIKRYLKEVKMIIPLHSKEKKEFLSILQQSIEDNHFTTYQDIVEGIGQPTEIASSFINEMDSVQLIKELNKKRYIKILLTIIILIVLTVGAVRVYYLTDLYNQVKNNQPVPVEEIIEVE